MDKTVLIKLRKRFYRWVDSSQLNMINNMDVETNNWHPLKTSFQLVLKKAH